MPYFDRFDICEAYSAFENDWNTSGWLPERPSNRRRKEGTHVQLARMGFRWGQVKMAGTFAGLSENGKAIYEMLGVRYNLRETG